MKLLLSGFVPRDELAFDLFLKRYLPGWRWHGQPATPNQMLPDADLLVIDLAAHGWAQFTEVTLTQLTQAVGNTVAVMLISQHDTSWQAAAASLHRRWTWLAKPYSAEAMRDSLLGAADLVKAQQQQNAARARPVHAVVPTESPVVPTHGMTADSLALRLVDWPAGRWVLLRKLLNGLQTHKPFEVRFTMQHVLIIHPSDDWVASNTPISVVLRVAGSDALAASVSVRELGLAQAEDRLHQLGAVPQGLSEFLHELVTQALPAAHPDTAPVP